MFRAVCIMLALFLMPIAGQAQEVRIKVSLLEKDVTAKDEAIKVQVLSYIRNTLRGIRDVDIVDKSYDYRIKIIASPVTVTLGQGYTHYALSPLVTEHVDIEKIIVTSMWPILNVNSKEFRFNNSIRERILREIKEEINITNFSTITYVFNGLFTYSDLKFACDAVVAAIDTDVFERHRRRSKNK